MAWIFAKTGRLPSEILALPYGERQICLMGARLEMMKEDAYRKMPSIAIGGGKK